jgi:serine/threonine protein kinase
MKSKFAVKIVLKELLPTSELAIIREEIAILSSLDHPNVVNYIESYEDTRYLYIIMENVEGALELKSFINKLEGERTDPSQPIMAEKDAARLMLMFSKGLHHIHTNGVVHRDIKPENCLMDKDGVLKIIDFGLARGNKSDLLGNCLVGTPLFISPEIYEAEGRGDVYKPAVDIYALGVSMFRILTGEFPFHNSDQEELEFEKIDGRIKIN